MPAQRTTRAPRARSQRDARRASEKTEQYRFAQNVAGSGTAAEREYEAYTLSGAEDPRGDPDVLLDVPVVKVDLIHLELDELAAHVALQARVLDLVRLNAGVDVQLGRLRIDIEGVEAQVLLKVHLDHVTAIVDRVLTTLDRNPRLVESLGRTVERVGEGAGHALGETGEAVESVGAGAGGAVEDVGAGAGQAVEQVGAGAGQAAGEIGRGAGEAVGEVGEGAGEAVGAVGQGAGGALGGLEQAVTGALQGNGGAGDALGAVAGSASTKDIAKLAARYVAQQLKAAATDEAKELGLAATRKAIEVGERRKQRKADEPDATEAAEREAEEPDAAEAAEREAQEPDAAEAAERAAEELNATEAAMREAEDMGVSLQEVEGSGPQGRITVRDVRQARES
jgi:e3 binding domain